MAAPLQAAEPVAALPYRIDYGGWITVTATINGQGPYDFLIDTGSTITLAFENLSAIQTFSPTGRPPIRVLGITGAGELDTFVLGDIGLGAARLHDHVGVILPDWAPPARTPHGIIGIDFLRRFAVHFDPNARIMTLYAHGGLPRERTNRLSKVKLNPQNFGATSGELYTAKARIRRGDVTFIIDLGSATTLINYKAAERLYSRSIAVGAQATLTGTRLGDIFDDRTRARTALLPDFSLGGVTWRRHPVWVYNAPLFDEIGVQQAPYGLAGVDLLADREFALDFGENEMWIARHPR